MSTIQSSSARVSDASSPRCPFLGMADDADTWIFQSAYDNYCHRPKKPQPVDLAYQASTCLSDSHTECPLFQHDGVWSSALPGHIKGTSAPNYSSRRPSPVLLGVGLIGIGLILSLGVAVVMMMTRGGLGAPSDMLDQNQASASTPALIASPQAVTPTIADSAPQSSPIAENPPTLPDVATVEPVIVPLNEAADLHALPDIESPVLAGLSAGSSVTILGQDELGAWISVRTEQGFTGWILSTQLSESIQVALLPVVESSEGSPVLPTLSQGDAGGDELDTTVVELPSRFDILLRYSSFPNEAKCFGNLNLDFTFDIAGSSLTLQRQSDDLTFRGSYQEDTGEFEVEAAPAYGREELFGFISFDGETITITGEQYIYYNDRDCIGHWSVAGEAEVESAP